LAPNFAGRAIEASPRQAAGNALAYAVQRGRCKRRSTMPTYEFVCEKCNKTFALAMTVAEYEKKKTKCPKCGGKKVKQIVSSFQTVTSKKS
jgi:putative FmdB family regulatory protein